MHHQTKISMKIPMDFFDGAPVFKTDLESLKGMFSSVMCASLMYVHIAVIAFIFIVMGTAVLI